MNQHFRYPTHRIHEIVRAPKCVAGDGTVRPEKRGEQGAKFDVALDLIDGPFTDLRYIGKSGALTDPSTYDANLLLDQQRVRGVGFCAVGRQNFRAKLRIPAGWHQNVCDPNVSTDDPNWNRHDALPSFSPTDFEDFTRKTALLWNIDLGWEGGLL